MRGIDARSSGPNPMRWLTFGVLLVGAVCVASDLLMEWLVRIAYFRQGPEWLNRLIANSDGGPLEYYVTKVRVLWSRAALGLVGCVGLAWGVRNRSWLRVALGRFFTEPDAAINLAVFRFAVFLVAFLMVDPVLVRTFAELPSELRVMPGIGGVVMACLPFDPDTAVAAARALQVICVCGMLGLCSRSAALAAAILGFYVFGIPQCYGKVNHYHHVIWFLVLLSVSRCGDALSVDALLRRRTGVPFLNRLIGPAPSTEYGFPLRVAWLLFGVVYFFPGFWKLWACGVEWGFAENLSLHMYHKWASLGDWRPVFRIDQHPWMVTLSGIGTLIFELGFWLAVFSRRTRAVVAVSGLAFHNMTNLFMGIAFWNLQALYVAFVPWDRLFHRVANSADGDIRHKVPRTAAVVGAMLLCINITMGWAHAYSFWPVACYPTFDAFSSEVRSEYQLREVRGGIAEVVVPLGRVTRSISPERLEGMFRHVASAPEESRTVVEHALTCALSRFVSHDATEIRVYTITRDVRPDAEHRSLSERLVVTLPVRSNGTALRAEIR